MPVRTAGERIKARRLELKLTQVQLAKTAGIGQSALSSIESGDTAQLRGGTLLGLSKALGKPPEWIQTGAEVGAAVPDADFRELLGKLDASNRWRLLALGYALLAEQSGKRPTAADPFPGVPKPPRKALKVPR